MGNSFDTAFNYTLGREGGLVDNAMDPGGRTKYGVTQKTLDRARLAHPDLNLPQKIDDVTVDQCKELYRRDYWNTIRGEDLPQGVAFAVFDACVNTNIIKVIKWLQAAAGVSQDGVVGTSTLSAVRATVLKKLLLEFHARRAYNYMIQDAIDDEFGLGWARRLMLTYDTAINIGA
jgi:lysozyme family protein